MSMRPRPRPSTSQAGFTLVEGLIVVIMLGVIGSAFVSLMMAQDRFYSRLDEGINAEQSVRIAADREAWLEWIGRR